MTPADLRPEGAGDEREQPEDDALVDRDVALEIRARLSLPEVEEALPGTPAEADVGGQRHRNVEIEDLLVQPVLVDGRIEEDQRDSARDQPGRQRHEGGHGIIP